MKTIIYYTANRENPDFERKIMDGIKSVCGDIPIVSVSQKPIDFGKNICVGDVGHSYLNAFRQLLMGCYEATTEYVIMTEADFLYPADYFNFEPTDPNMIYTYDNCWIMYRYNNLFYRKEQTHGSIIYGRLFLINLLEESLKGLPEWSDKKVDFPFYTKDHKFESFTGSPIISVKTGDGIQKSTRLMNELPRERLEYWGYAKNIKERLWNQGR